MSPPALQWFGGGGRRDYASRGTAALLAIVFNVAFLYLLVVSLRLIPVPESPPVESILTRLIDQPRGQHRAFDLRSHSVHVNRLAFRVPDTPPNVRIQVPIEAPPVQQRSDMHTASPPGSKDVPGAESSRGVTAEPGEGEGAAALHEVGPVYGTASVRSHEQGIVTVRVLVDQDGRPSEMRLLQSSGFPLLDQSAIKAVQRYRFTPQIKGSDAGQSWTTVKLEFDLIPMPVPTTIIGFDSLVAEQIADARRVDIAVGLIEVLKTTGMLDRLAHNLLASLSGDPAAGPDPGHARSSPTPIQALASLGGPRSVQFVGYARRGFDCGTASLPGDAGDFVCEIFRVKQLRGTSYWLAAMGNDGTRLKNLLIAVDTHYRR